MVFFAASVTVAFAEVEKQEQNLFKIINSTIKPGTVKEKIVHKDEYCPIDDTIVFDNVVVDNESYNIVDCYFGDGKLYKIIMKRYVGAEYINQIPEMKFNPEIQKELMDGEKFIVQQIFVDTKSKYNY